MDLACYDRDYGPQAERDRARAAHLAAWPDAVDAAIASLDPVTAPVGQALAGAVRGLAAGIPSDAEPEWPLPRGPRTRGWCRTSNRPRPAAARTRRSAAPRSAP